MPPNRRRGARPDAQALDELAQAPAAGGRLRKAPAGDPVLGATGTAPETVVGQREGDADQLEAKRSATRTPRATRAPASSSGKAKVGFYQDPDATARARAAYDWTRPQERHRSFSDFISAAVMREVERLEAEYHDGQPWPNVNAGQLPTGKPLGS